MNKHIHWMIIGCQIVLIFVSLYLIIKAINKPDSIICETPHINFGISCCSDKNNNSICESYDRSEISPCDMVVVDGIQFLDANDENWLSCFMIKQHPIMLNDINIHKIPLETLLCLSSYRKDNLGDALVNYYYRYNKFFNEDLMVIENCTIKGG